MRGLCLMLFRFCPPAWVGAATLFVLVTISTARSEDIDSEMRMRLTTVRFPVYYAMEFSLLGIALGAGLLGRKHGELGRIRGFFGLLLITIALAGAIGDFFWIYRPLAEMMHEKTLTEDFHHMHEGSKHVNSTIVAVVMIAAVVINWPSASHRRL